MSLMTNWNKTSASRALGPLLPDFTSIMLGTGFHEFRSPHGIQGLAKLDGSCVMLLVVMATRPKTGQFHRFIDACKEEFEEIQIHEVWNPLLDKILSSYGFVEFSDETNKCKTTGWKWTR